MHSDSIPPRSHGSSSHHLRIDGGSTVSQGSAGEGLAMAEAGERFLAHKETLGLKRSTLMDYECTIRVHLVPFFGSIALEEVDLEMIEAFMAAKRSEGKAVKSVQNYTVVLHAIFVQGVRRGWCSRNPVAAVEKPRVSRTDPDIRFLTNEELEALIAAVPDDELGRTERAIYLTAAMTSAEAKSSRSAGRTST